MNRLAIAERLASIPAKGRIMPVKIGGVRVWLKDFDQPSPAKWHSVQRLVFAIVRFDLLRPVPSLSGVEGANNEIAAIRAFGSIGVRVPEVLWAEGARIAISDIGETIRDMQDRVGVSASEASAVSAARELSRIHANKLVHGRPIPRNLTWDGETVGFIDFEERPTEVMSHEAAEARDIMLFLISLGRRSDDTVLQSAFDAYAEGIRPVVENQLRRIVRHTGLFVEGPGRVLARSGDRNIRGLIGALKAVRRKLHPAAR